MKNQFGRLALTLLLFLAVFLGSRYYYQSLEPKVETSGLYDHLGGDFTLTHISGDKSLKDLKGKPSVLYFGFTSCPDICPLSLNKLNKVIDKIGPKTHGLINKVFISVDYKRDDPKKVDEYGRYFSDDFISLAGSEEQIKDITKKYAVHFEFVPLKDSALGYTVDHTSRFYLLGADGKIVNTYSDIINDPKFTNDLKELLK